MPMSRQRRARKAGRRRPKGPGRDLKAGRKMGGELLAVSEREQQRIGHALHDGLCQELAGIAFAVQSMQRKASGGEKVQPAELAEVTRMLQDSVRHARGLSHGLWPVSPQPNGLSVALGQLAANTAEVFKVECAFVWDPARPVEMRDAVAATHLYRIAQQSVRDAIRYGKASRIEITLAATRRGISVSVADNGIGLATPRRGQEGGDLQMMRHRARVLGGKLRLRSDERGGARVTCEVPSPR